MKIRKITKRIFVQYASVDKKETKLPMEIGDDDKMVFCFMKSVEGSEKTKINVWSLIFLAHMFNLYIVQK